MRSRNNQPKRKKTPPPATTPSASPGIFGTILQGFAFGTGSSVAHRTVDSIVSGPERVQDETSPHQTPPVATTKLSHGECYELINEYYQCLGESPHPQCDNLTAKMEGCLWQSRLQRT